MTRTLGPRTTLENLKKEAKRRQRELRARDGAAAPSLREVQHALAREHGLASWAALKQELDDRALAARGAGERALDLLELASLHYGVRWPDGPERRRRAARIVERHPEVARHDLCTAVVCGDLDEVRRRLAIDPEAARRQGGREGWEPLLFLCYGRLPGAEHAVEIATELLDRGADPNAAWSYEDGGQTITFSALCGVIGDGEMGPVICPPHPRAEALAALLLDRGADPNQSQALYDTMLRGDDPRWLRVLIARGLGPEHRVTWQGEGGARLFEYLLDNAVRRNQLARARVLLEAGARPDGLFERALLAGNGAMAELLAEHGAARVEPEGPGAFRAACARGDRAAAERLLAERPALRLDAAHLLAEVALADNVDVARLLLDLGVSPDVELGTSRPLHLAASAGAARVAALLVERGAVVDARDRQFAATPLAWAVRARMDDVAALLAARSRDPFTLVAGGLTGELRRLLDENPAAARTVTPVRLGLGHRAAEPGATPIHVLPDDEEAAGEIAELLLAYGADPPAVED